MVADATPHQALAKLGLTCVSASIAESFTYPIDAVKTRLQLQGQQHQAAVPRRGAVATAIHVLRNEGVKGLYAGLTPAVVRHVFYSGTRITTYETLRSAWQPSSTGVSTSTSASDSTQRQQQQSSLGLGSKLVMGLVAGGLGQLVAVPADLTKVILQSDSRAVAAGLQAAPRYKGMLHALRTITAEQGLAGLWKGTVPAVQRAALVNLGELATYDAAKQQILASGQLGDGLLAHAAASLTSGLVATTVSTPADVIKTRVMAQDPARPLYKGSVDCLVKSVRQEGILTLYKGFFPTWLRLGPWQMVFWVSYEELRSVSGLGTF